MIVDGLGSSEAGGRCRTSRRRADGARPARSRRPGNHVLCADLDRELGRATRRSAGWPRAGASLSATSTTDEDARTYPVVDGVRYVVPGDRARQRADGMVELHGATRSRSTRAARRSSPRRVEAAIKAHEAVYDCVVADDRASDGAGGRRGSASVRARRVARRCSRKRHARRATSSEGACVRRRGRTLPVPARPTTAGPSRSPATSYRLSTGLAAGTRAPACPLEVCSTRAPPWRGK